MYGKFWILKKFIKRVRVFQKYSELCLPVKTMQLEEGGGEIL
jgi:hypothetical protein